MLNSSINKRVCAVIVDYKSLEKTLCFVQNEVTKYEAVSDIIIVANAVAEKDETVFKGQVDSCRKYLQERQSPVRLHFLPQDENLGYARGNNLGVTFTKNNLWVDFVLILNNDLIFPDPNGLNKLLEFYDTRKNIGVLGPRIVDITGRDQSPHKYIDLFAKYGMRNIIVPAFPFLFKKIKYQTTVAKAKSGVYDRLIGCFLLIKMENYFASGMMDEHTFLFGEEAILSTRLRSIGLETYYCSEVTIIHDHGFTINKHINNRKKLRLEFESDAYYYLNYMGASKIKVVISRLCLEFLLLVKKIRGQ